MFKKKTRFGETNCLLDLVFRNWERGNFLRTSFNNISLPGKWQRSQYLSSQELEYLQLGLKKFKLPVICLHEYVVIVESSLIFIRGCNSLKLCLYFPENAPGTRNKISRKRDLWSPNMTHSDLNLLAWCYVANQNTNRRNLDKTHTVTQLFQTDRHDCTILVTMVKNE